MRIILMGGRPLGARCLKELIKQNKEVVAVVPNIDDIGEDTWYPSTKKIAEEAGLRVHQPKNINSKESIKTLIDLEPDVIFGLIFLQIIKKPLLELPPKGVINIHYAPLPRYRGFWPVMRAIVNGETVHGTTMHYMTEALDAGDIICQREFPILPEDSGRTAYDRGTDISFEMFKDMLPLIESDAAPRVPQDHSKATYYKKEIPNQGMVDWSWDKKQIRDFIRALDFPPYPGARL